MESGPGSHRGGARHGRFYQLLRPGSAPEPPRRRCSRRPGRRRPRFVRVIGGKSSSCTTVLFFSVGRSCICLWRRPSLFFFRLLVLLRLDPLCDFTYVDAAVVRRASRRWRAEFRHREIGPATPPSRLGWVGRLCERPHTPSTREAPYAIAATPPTRYAIDAINVINKTQAADAAPERRWQEADARPIKIWRLRVF